MNTFGRHFRVTSFGESHGPAMGVVIDGCPAGIPWNEELLLRELARRRPGSTASVTSRNEADFPRLLSGVHQGKTLGTPIALVVENKDCRSEDYEGLPDRPGHADDLWRKKFGHSDPRGGGRASGRETLSRVMAGAVAQMAIKVLVPELTIRAFAKKIGPLELTEENQESEDLENLLIQAKAEGQSYGGEAQICVDRPPLGLGQPVFAKLKSELAAALLGIGATYAVEIGDVPEVAKGTEFHGPLTPYGGIRGGISTGESLQLTLKFKPTASVLDVAKKGRHDPCIIPRALPVAEAMVALVLIDHLLWQRLDQV